MGASGEKVAVITATWDSVKVEAYIDHIRMIACMASRLPPDTLIFACEPRRPIAEACMAQFNGALNLGAQWILWVDDDICPPPDVYFRLREHADPDKCPVISALGFFRGQPYWPGVFKYERWNPTDNYSIGKPLPDCRIAENQVVRVDATGLPCTLVHRSVFDRIRKPWFKQGGDYTPDGWFMQQLAEARIPVHCHTGVICGHLVNVKVDDRTFRAWCRQNGGIEAAEKMALERFRIGCLTPVEAGGEEIKAGTDEWRAIVDSLLHRGLPVGDPVGSRPPEVLAGSPEGDRPV